jgi:hypothetical protein
MQKHLLAGLVFFFVSLTVWGIATEEEDPPQKVRFFKNVDPDRTITQVLSRGQFRKGYGNSVDVVELDASMRPITGDTISLWVQHYEPGQKASRLLRKSQEYDLLVHCFPQQVPDGVRTDNVLPKADSLVYVYPLRGTQYSVVSGQKSDLLKFLSVFNQKNQYQDLR